MTSANNMLSDNNIINVNDEFKSLNELFNCNGWKIGYDNKLLDHIIYSKPGNETEFFEILLDNNIIYVSIPLKNSTFQYKTKFNNYYSAIKYTEDKFHYFINNPDLH